MPKLKSNLLKLVLVLFSFSILASLLPQVILPIASVYGANVAGEDIVLFIYYSGFNPFAVSAITAGQLLFSAWYLIRVGRLKEFISWVTSQIPQQSTATRWQKVLIIGLLLVGILGLRSVSSLRTHEQMAPLEYDAKIEIDFADHNNGTIYEFALDDYQVYHFVYSLDTKDPVTLKLTTMNPSGFLYTPGKIDYHVPGCRKTAEGPVHRFHPRTWRLSD
ncbi:MAG TPA: hypothetical protein VFC74_10255 [Oscillospiraceae bacterium]|nr:hypothetical protein [Oscillospiraceae bacterium]